MTRIDPGTEKFIQENVQLMVDGNYDEVYRLAAAPHSGTRVSTLTQALWNCDIHPELEGLTEIPATFAANLDLKTFRVPQGITCIRDYAFYNCYSLSSVLIPEGVRSIGFSAFRSCSSLSSLDLPSEMSKIEGNAFWECDALTSVTIPDGIKRIIGATFLSCGNLAVVRIPDSVISIGNKAFEECSRLVEIHYNGTKEQWKAIDKGKDWKKHVGSLKVHCTNGDIKYK